MIDTPSRAIPSLRFAVEDVAASRSAVVPSLRLRLRIEADGEIRAIALTVAVHIAAERRRYAAAEGERLRELFGEPEQWARSLGAIPWTRAVHNVTCFADATTIEVALPCSYDFDVAAAKYLAALEEGVIPVDLLFTGTVTYCGDDGRLQTTLIGWDSETSQRIPLALWREAVESAFPGSAWLRLDRRLFARLQAYRSRRGLTDWDAVLETLLAESEG